jgi:hypothetical protein
VTCTELTNLGTSNHRLMRSSGADDQLFSLNGRPEPQVRWGGGSVEIDCPSTEFKRLFDYDAVPASAEGVNSHDLRVSFGVRAEWHGVVESRMEEQGALDLLSYPLNLNFQYGLHAGGSIKAEERPVDCSIKGRLLLCPSRMHASVALGLHAKSSFEVAL